MYGTLSRPIRRIGFVAKRLAGTDGVSLETAKWTEILEQMGYECHFITGESDRAPERTFLIPEADFNHPTIAEIQRKCFGRRSRIRQMSRLIRTTAHSIKEQLYAAFEAFQPDLIIAENCLTIPMNISLGAALEETLLETETPCVAHHHDFVWERDRFLINAVPDYLAALFPPRLEQWYHVVINSLAGHEFSRRTGLPYHIVPNVMDFDNPPPPLDDYTRDFRKTIGLDEDDILILQPTRVVRRKGIEHSIELVHRLDDPRCKLVITHEHGDEGPQYYERIKRYAELLNVSVIFADPWIRHERGTTADGRKCYTIWDAYPFADLVTYPSTYEGFGNAFLEAVYYKKPIFCNRYTCYRTDIEPLGFRAVAIDGFVTDETVDAVRCVLADKALRDEIVEHNYKIARHHFSYRRVERELHPVLAIPHCSATSSPRCWSPPADPR